MHCALTHILKHSGVLSKIREHKEAYPMIRQQHVCDICGREFSPISTRYRLTIESTDENTETTYRWDEVCGDCVNTVKRWAQRARGILR